MEEEVNPYRSPPVGISVPKPKRGSPLKAVLLAVLLDIGGSLVASLVFAIAASFVLGFKGVPAEQVGEELQKLSQDPSLLMTGNIVGCLFSLLAGYVCARVAKRSEYKMAGIVASISAAVSFLLGMGYYTVYMNALFSLLAVLCVMLGAARGVVRNKRKA